MAARSSSATRSRDCAPRWRSRPLVRQFRSSDRLGRWTIKKTSESDPSLHDEFSGSRGTGPSIALDLSSRLKDWSRVGLDRSRPILSRHFAQALHFGPRAGLKGLVECLFPKVQI